jgi:predicted AAA+ superfamily ATPase
MPCFDGDFEALAIAPCSRPELTRWLLSGGFPEAVRRELPHRRSAWFDNYLDAILQSDVRDLAQVEQLHEVPNLLALLASRSGGLLNLAELARSSGLPTTTLRRYFGLLETLFLVHRLPSWEKNPGKRLVKSPKALLPDTGLLAHLAGHAEDRLNTAPGLPGGLVETFVLGELLKHLAFSQRRLTLWHYRTHAGVEVDFILEGPSGAVTGVEVKASGSVESKDFAALRGPAARAARAVPARDRTLLRSRGGPVRGQSPRGAAVLLVVALRTLSRRFEPKTEPKTGQKEPKTGQIY